MNAAPQQVVAEATSTAEFLASAAFFCFVFWDFYMPSQGIRPLDIIGAILLALGLCSPHVRRQSSASADVFLPILGLLVMGAAVTGAIADDANIRAAIGICAGVVVFVLFSFWPLTTRGVLRVLNAALVADVLGFWAQFTWYYASGTVLNFHAVLGGEPRVFAPFFRAAGLYLEPAHFALMSFSLLVLKIYFSERLDSICWATIIAMIACLSLWGAVSAAILLAVWFVRRRRGLLLVSLILIGVAMAVLITGFWQKISVLDRLAHFASDPSAKARYGGLEQFSATQLWQFAFWFGRGVSLDYQGMGYNSLSYLFTSVGAMGVAVICGGVVARSKSGMRFYILATLSLALTAAYLWTFMFWWSWLALIGRSDLRPEALA